MEKASNMTKQEIADEAMAEFGEEISQSLKQSEMAERLNELRGITDDTPGDTPNKQNNEDTPSPPKNSGKFKITIFEEKGAGPFIDLAVNGKAVRIMRGKEVVIAEAYLHALKNAVEDVYEPVEDENGVITTIKKSIPRHNFSYEPA